MSRKWKDFAAAAAVLLLLPCAAALLGGAELPGFPREMGGRAGSAGDSGTEGQAGSGTEGQVGSGAEGQAGSGSEGQVGSGTESQAAGGSTDTGWRIRYAHDGVVESMEPEDYVRGAAFAALPEWAEEELMKAQIVLVRTNVLRSAQEWLGQAENAGETEVPAEALPESWQEPEERRSSLGEAFFPFYQRYLEAWQGVEGYVLTADGALAEGAYHLVSAGRTRDAEAVIGDGYPYLLSVECPKDFESEEYLFRREFGLAQWESQLAGAGIAASGEKVEILRRDDAGYVLSIRVGERILGGEQFREAMGLRSSHFTIEYGQEQVAVVTKGVGHGIGMSQYGANEMAREGRTWEEILSCFFPGTEVEKCE